MTYVKVVTAVPVSFADTVRQAAGDVIGVLDNYSHATFSVRGVGRFIPQEGANPTIGVLGKMEEVEEEQIWFTCPQEKIEAVVDAIRHAHPYEAPAIDVYPLETL